MRHRTLGGFGLAAALAAAAFCGSVQAVLAANLPAQPGGCTTIGNGPVVTEAFCDYIALDDSQNVLAVIQSAPDGWYIVVDRCCLNSDPSQCVPLIHANGTVPSQTERQCLTPADSQSGQPLYHPHAEILMQSDGSEPLRQGSIHPIPGEDVIVYLGHASGLISVGLDEAIVPGGLPLP